MMLYIQNPKGSTKKLLELINKFSKLEERKLISRNQLFLYANNVLKVREISKTIPFTIAWKIIKILKNKPNQGCTITKLYSENQKTLKKKVEEDTDK